MAIDERTGTPVAERRHRVHAFVGRVDAALDDILGPDGTGFVSLCELGVGDTRESITDLDRIINRLHALQGRLLDQGERLSIGTATDEHGEPPTVPATTTAGWLADAVTTPLPLAKKTVKLATRLEDSFHHTAHALASGRIDRDQAVVIVEAVDALPDFVLEAERRSAEDHLLTEARVHHAWDLKKLARHLLEVIDPDGLDEHLATQLAADEARAARTTFFELRDDGHGTVHGRFAIPGLDADMLAVALHAIASPQRPDAIDRGEDYARPTPEVLGQAFCEYIERFPAQALPVAGGINATVVVTMTLDSLLGDLSPAVLDTGRRITAEEARRLASQCGVVPAVLGSQSEVLDLGRKVRLHTAAQRTALRVKHKTCAVEGCTVPAAWCHVDFPGSHGHRHSGLSGHGEVSDGDVVFAGVQRSDRRAASTRSLVYGAGQGVQSRAHLDLELGACCRSP